MLLKTSDVYQLCHDNVALLHPESGDNGRLVHHDPFSESFSFILQISNVYKCAVHKFGKHGVCKPVRVASSHLRLRKCPNWMLCTVATSVCLLTLPPARSCQLGVCPTLPHTCAYLHALAWINTLLKNLCRA